MAIKKPSKIFVGSTMELFGEWVKRDWLEDVFEKVRHYSQHTFIFLTKRPENLIKWSPFPDNAWMGVSAWDSDSFYKAIQGLRYAQSRVKFISMEPLLSWDHTAGLKHPLSTLQWIIIGQQTPARPSTQPQIEWIKEIIEAADMANVPVFLKDNLINSVPSEPPFWKETSIPILIPEVPGCRASQTFRGLRQEYPKV